MLPQRPLLGWRREYLPIRQRYSVPNIAGAINSLRSTDVHDRNAYSDGAFTWSDAKTSGGGFSYLNVEGNSEAAKFDPQFNASKSSSLFGSSDTVQPKALRSYCLIRYAA